MNKYYDASQEFKPFPNRTVGGALKEDLTYIKDRRPKRTRKAKQHSGPNVRIRTFEAGGWVHIRMRDGVIICGSTKADVGGKRK